MGVAICYQPTSKTARVATHRFFEQKTVCLLGRNWLLRVSEALQFVDSTAKYANKKKKLA